MRQGKVQKLLTEIFVEVPSNLETGRINLKRSLISGVKITLGSYFAAVLDVETQAVNQYRDENKQQFNG